MTAEYEHRSTVNKRYEPPSEEVREAFQRFMFDNGTSRFFKRSEAVDALIYLDSLDEHMVRALMYHARNRGLG